MTQKEYDKAPKIEQVLYNCTGFLAKNHPSIIEAMTIYAESEVKKLGLFSVTPRLFYVVAEIEEGVWEQITIGLETYKQAKDYKDGCDGKYPNAFIVSSLNEG